MEASSSISSYSPEFASSFAALSGGAEASSSGFVAAKNKGYTIFGIANIVSRPLYLVKYGLRVNKGKYISTIYVLFGVADFDSSGLSSLSSAIGTDDCLCK